MVNLDFLLVDEVEKLVACVHEEGSLLVEGEGKQEKECPSGVAYFAKRMQILVGD